MIAIGTSGWSYEDWRGTVYPAHGRVDGLTFLAEYFNVIEINSTFYRPPHADAARTWVKKVADRPEFVFTAKLWQRFTHGASPEFTDHEVRTFTEGIEPLAASGKLGAVLAQFSFAFEDHRAARARLKRIAECFGHWPLVLEVRHVSWSKPDALDFILSAGYSLAATDQPRTPRSMPPMAKGPIGYMRLHGRNRVAWFKKDAGRNERYDYLYTPEEMKSCAEAIKHTAANAKKTYVLANNHFRGQAVVNALQLRAMLENRKVAAPSSLIEAFPELGGFAQATDAPHQGRLI